MVFECVQTFPGSGAKLSVNLREPGGQYSRVTGGPTEVGLHLEVWYRDQWVSSLQGAR